MPVRHASVLRELKQRLRFQGDGAYVEDRGRRLPVRIDGPAFEVVELRVEPARGELVAVLDDDSQEPIGDDSLSMNEMSGRFECLCRGGRARAAFGRAAHQTLLELADEEHGRFFVRVGARRFPIRNV